MLRTAKAPSAKDIDHTLAAELETKAVIKSEYLFLPDLKQENAYYMVSMPPMNSSGDIYHILSYLMLCDAEKKRKPTIQLSFDGAQVIKENESEINTYTQIMRSLNFVRWLGQDETFNAPKQLDTGKCQREKKRQKELSKYLETLGNFVHILDQKALTTLITYYILQNDLEKTTNILRIGYMKRNPTFISEKTNNEIINKSNTQINKIKKHSGKNPLIVFHVRYSSKANNEQNIDNTKLLTATNDFLETKGYKSWFIFSDSRQTQSFSSITGNRTDVFPCPLTNDLTKTTADFGKLYHLQLLHDLYEVKNIRGIIGNTSGTLDLAAFLGHSVYNMHHFTTGINYQAYRILIQTAFISVDFFNEDLLKNTLSDAQGKIGKMTTAIAKEHLPNLEAWLDTKDHSQTFFPHLNTDISKIKIAAAGYNGLFFIKNKASATLIPLPCSQEIKEFVKK